MILSRIGVVTWVLSVAVLVLRVPTLAGTVDALGSPSFPLALGAVLELMLLGVAAWTALVLGGGLLGGAAARGTARLVPRALRGLLLAGVVTGLGMGTAHAGAVSVPTTSALVEQSVPHPAGDQRQVDRGGLDGLTLPDRPTLTSPSPPRPAESEAASSRSTSTLPTSPEPDADDTADAERVVVTAGDSLWAIAARTLGPDADDAMIAEETRRWHQQNRDVIGADPDVLHPGQELVAPRSRA